ncbi:murein hydrolase activator EnvC family protein [Janibacter corallicola]|uniref:murein hydrolase activator EnvC family protein n=1 Tax=Janibacter corallicola TaxID=415212 RepID=UPI00082E6ACE|nr:M23 family metallopeptidase [Janibacter corallicola]
MDLSGLAITLLIAVTAPAGTSTPQWSWPVGGGDHPWVAAPFRAPESTWGAGHRGIDLGTRTGAVVRAVADGRVTHRGRIAGRGTITLLHESGIRSTYEPVDSRLSVGDRVQEGQVIGRIGDEDGHCEPKVCLHLGAKVDEGYRDPLPFFDGPRRVVLLPME